MSFWGFGRVLGEQRRALHFAVHASALVFFVLVTMLAVFVFVSRLF